MICANEVRQRDQARPLPFLEEELQLPPASLLHYYGKKCMQQVVTVFH